jgi:hypothetical protein
VCPPPPIPRSSVETSLVIPAHRGDGVHLRTREATRLLDHPDDRVSARTQHQPPGQLLTHRHCLAAQPSIRRLETDHTLFQAARSMTSVSAGASASALRLPVESAFWDLLQEHS